MVYQNSLADMQTMEVIFPVFFFIVGQILAKLADKCFPEFRLNWLVDEVKKNLPNELDFLHEARNMMKAREIFRHLRFLKVLLL